MGICMCFKVSNFHNEDGSGKKGAFCYKDPRDEQCFRLYGCCPVDLTIIRCYSLTTCPYPPWSNKEKLECAGNEGGFYSSFCLYFLTVVCVGGWCLPHLVCLYRLFFYSLMMGGGKLRLIIKCLILLRSVSIVGESFVNHGNRILFSISPHSIKNKSVEKKQTLRPQTKWETCLCVSQETSWDIVCLFINLFILF